MKLKEFTKYLNIDNIYDDTLPSEYLNIYHESYSSSGNHVILSLGHNIENNPHYTIEFDTYISWKVKNSLGDGYITDNFDYVEDLEIEIDLINIENYFCNNPIKLDDSESIDKINNWIKSIIFIRKNG